MAKKSAKTFTVFRDSKTGRFLQEDRIGRGAHDVVKERIPKPGSINPKSARVIKKTDRKYDKVLRKLAKR